MTYHLQHARQAMTAIAAVLAFSSTPLLAQETGTPPPVADPAPEAAPPAADPLAPEPAPAESTTTAAKSSPAPAKAKATTTARRAVTTTRSTTRSVARSAAPAPAAAPVAEAAAPVAPPAAPSAVPVEPGPVPVAEPDPSIEPAANTGAIDVDEALPYVGGGALGLILLAGAAAVRRRRRHKQEDADEAAKLAFIDASEQEHRQETLEPSFDRSPTPRHDPVPVKAPVADAPVTELPEDFDLSRFGPHVQAAYRGPTEDNPSLSLKHRLRRASFLDQQEKRAAEEAGAMPTKTPEPMPAKSNWESTPNGEFILRRAGTKPELQHH